MKFLSKPSKTFSEKARTVLLAYLVLFVWIIAVQHFLNFLYPPSASDGPSFPAPPTPILYEIFMACILAPLWEELAFRHAPGLLVKAMGEQFTLPVVIISSALFGWGHGHGEESILRQGAMGFLFFWVYMKNGYSYWSSVILHAAWNTTVFVMMNR